MMHENTVDYILGRFTKQDSLNARMSEFASVTDDTMRVLTKTVTKLTKAYKNMSIVSIILLVCGYLSVRKIKELEDEIKELKKSKGE